MSLHNFDASRRVSQMPNADVDRDLDQVIRTRGAIRFGAGIRSDAARRTSTTSLDARPDPDPWEFVKTVEELLQTCRSQAGELPLTILIERSDSSAARDFLRFIQPTVRDDDALWLVGSQDPEAARLASEGVVALHLEDEDDRRIYANLVCDLVFIPCDDEKVPDIASWHRRTSVLVIKSLSRHADALVNEARRIGVTLFQWAGTKIVQR